MSYFSLKNEEWFIEMLFQKKGVSVKEGGYMTKNEINRTVGNHAHTFSLCKADWLGKFLPYD